MAEKKKKKAGRLTTVSIRLNEDERRQIVLVAKANGLTLASQVRMAIMRYVAEHPEAARTGVFSSAN